MQIIAKGKDARFDQNRYIRQWTKENVTRVSVVLSRKNDADIIDHLETIKGKSQYIKKLIRADMNGGGKSD